MVDSLALVDTAVSEILSQVSTCKLSVDAEGVDLGRTGALCILQVAVFRLEGATAFHVSHVYLFDVHTLGVALFDRGVRAILENPSIFKIMFDCRGDAAALYHQFQVTLQGVLDMQVATHNGYKWLSGFKKTLDKYDIAATAKEEGVTLFAPERGGSYEVWKRRPLHPALCIYAVEDVRLAVALFAKIQTRVSIEALAEKCRRRITNAIAATSAFTAASDL